MSAITIEQLKHLSYAEKLQLVEDLWDAIAEEAASQPIAPALREELERRRAEHLAHPETGESWESVKAEIEMALR